MTLASDAIPSTAASLLSPEANRAAAFAAAHVSDTGVLTIDLDAIIANWRKLEKRGVPAECAAVVKADAYGCGLAPVMQALSPAGCKTFFVATPHEARAARAAVKDAVIYVLDGYFQNCGDVFA